MISPIWKTMFSLIILSATLTQSIPLNPNAVSHNKRAGVDSSVQYSINIISSPEQFQIGAPFSMKCFVNPQLRDIKYSWFKNDKSISNDETVRFGSLKKEDLGSYKCVVSGKTETGMTMELEATAFQRLNEGSNQINTERIDSQTVQYSVNIISSPERFEIGASFSMRCQVTPRLRNVKYSWFKDGRLISNDETLRFDRLSKEDLGSYKCVVSGQTESGATIELEATTFQKMSEFDIQRFENQQRNNRINNERIDSKSVQYSVNIISSVERFQIGEPFWMRCQVTPQLREVRYSWFKDGRLVGNEETLRFTTLKKEDLGSYRCVVTGKTENGMTIEMEATAFMKVTEFESRRIEYNQQRNNQIPNERINTESVQYSVRIISSAERFQLGQSFSMRCQVTPQLREVRYSWFKDGRLISNEETIRIGSLRKEDLGSYRCVVTGKAENGMSIEMEASAFIKVSEFETQRIGNHRGTNQIGNKRSTSEYVEYSVNIISSPEQFELGTPFSMKCLVDPQMRSTQYSWFKDDQLISNKETVYFRSLKKEDLGSYRCVVSGITETGDSMELEATAFQKFYD